MLNEHCLGFVKLRRKDYCFILARQEQKRCNSLKFFALLLLHYDWVKLTIKLKVLLIQLSEYFQLEWKVLSENLLQSFRGFSNVGFLLPASTKLEIW